MTGAFGEEVGQQGAVGEVDGDVDGAGDVGLVEVKLLEEGGEEDGGGEDGGFCVQGGGEREEGRVLDSGRAVFFGVGGGVVGVRFEGGGGFGGAGCFGNLRFVEPSNDDEAVVAGAPAPGV